jgi:alkanesulfonate monooxygenase
MPVEIIGLLFHADSSEVHPLKGVYDRDYIRECAQAHEAAGFDRVLIGQTATWPDGLATAGYVASVTERLRFMVAHRPGFVAPTMAARMFATLDQLSGGRAGVHIITGSSDIETQCDGDFLTKVERYRRSREYVDILRRMWTSPTPFDHEGANYRFKGGFAPVKPLQPSIPVFWGGASPLAIELGAECADVYAIGGSTLAKTRALVGQVREHAAQHGRAPSISMSMRVIIGATEQAAWHKADAILRAVVDYQRDRGPIGRDKGKDDLGARTVLETAAEGERLDERLWMGLAKATQGRLHATTLVGTAAQVSDALLRYYEFGVDRFLLNGFYNISDVSEMGRELIPLIRAGVGARDGAPCRKGIC